eukprot:ANDGO_00785.mRNA.1 hypothetical protein
MASPQEKMLEDCRLQIELLRNENSQYVRNFEELKSHLQDALDSKSMLESALNAQLSQWTSALEQKTQEIDDLRARMIPAEEFQYVSQKVAAAEEKLAATRHFELQNMDFAARIESLMEENKNLRAEQEKLFVEKEDQGRIMNRQLSECKLHAAKLQSDGEHWRRQTLYLEKELQESHRKYDECSMLLIAAENQRDLNAVEVDRAIKQHQLCRAEFEQERKLLEESLSRYRSEVDSIVLDRMNRARLLFEDIQDDDPTVPLKRRIADLEKETAARLTEASEYKQLNASLRLQLASTEARKAEAEAETKQYSDIVGRLKKQLRETEVRLVEVERDAEVLHGEKSAWSDKLHEKQRDVEVAQTRIAALDLELREARAALADEQDRHSESRTTLLSEVSLFKKQASMYSLRVADVEEHAAKATELYRRIIAGLKNKKSSASNALAAVSAEKDHLKRVFDVENAATLERMRELERTVDKLRLVLRLHAPLLSEKDPVTGAQIEETLRSLSRTA